MGCCCSNASYDISGNRIRGGGQLEHDLYPGSIRRRGRHVIKVFAQVFELARVFGGEDSNDVVETNIDDEDQFDWIWNELCEVPVHVNLTCVQEGEIYEYTVCAEEKEICPFNSTITIPGTEIRNTGVYFVQWKDPYTGTVYGLNFFTEQEALRFLSSCFPPNITPDMAVRRSTSAPSYPCPSPPAPVTDLPFLNKMSNGRSISDGLEDQEDTPSQSLGGDTIRSSTPERDAEEFFNMVIGAIKPLRSYMMHSTPNELSGTNGRTGLKSFDTFDNYVANHLPNSESVTSDLDDRPLSVESLPSPPSQFNLTSDDSSEGVNAAIDQATTKEEETKDDKDNGELDEGKNQVTSESGDGDDIGDHGDGGNHGDGGDIGDIGDDDIELYQRKGPVEYDKTLNDIPEEEEEEDPLNSSSSTSHSLSISGMRIELKRMEKLVMEDDEEEVEMNETADSLRQHLSQSMSADSLNSTVQDFDRLLQDLEESELLEITMSGQKTGLSRQTSFVSQPPSLPCSLPPGPTLSANVEKLEGEFNTDQFKNALKRLSVTSLENVLLSDMPDLPESVPPGKLLSPQQSSADVTTNHATQQDRNGGTRFPTLSSLPPYMSMRADTFDEDEGSGLQRHASFLRHRFNPPEEFGSDSGVPNTDNELDQHPTEENDEQLFVDKESRLLQALRIADLNNRTKDSSPSTSPPSEGRDRRNRSGDDNWLMASKPLFGEEAITKDDSIIKSGWLEVKELLIRKNKKVAMKSRRKWKKYWALLKGVNLILYKWDSETLITDDTPYDSKLDVSGCLAYPVTNHMRRDYIFSLTTATGNTYYMEAICRSAADEWIQELHIASALDLTAKTIRGEALDEISRIIRKLEEDIQTARRMKNLAELQLTSTAENKTQINKQITSFLEDTDRLHVDLYRIKCYHASLSGAELPNPQSILGIISKTTKNIVSKIGMYSVASLQSVMSTRYSKPVELPDSPSSLTVIQEQNAEDVPKRKEKKGFRLFSGSSSGFGPRRKLKFPSPVITSPTASDHVSAPHLLTFHRILEPDPLMTGFGSLLTIQLYNGKTCEVPFKIDLNVEDVIINCCQKYGLDPSDHFLLAEKDNENVIPNEDTLINNLNFEYLSVKQKFIQEVHFDSSVAVEDRGLLLKPDLRNLGAVTHALIGTVPPNSPVQENGLMEGDEVVLINDAAVSHMTWKSVVEALKEPELTITVRMCRVNVPVGVASRTTHYHLKDLVCPSPPLRDRRISPEKIDNLIVPKPSDISPSFSLEEDEENNDNNSCCSDQEEDVDQGETTLAPDESERVKQLIKIFIDREEGFLSVLKSCRAFF